VDSKNGGFPPFFELRLLISSSDFSGRRAFRIDNLSRERNALAALGLKPQRPVRLARAHRAVARRSADIAFPDSIAHANDHSTLTSLRSLLG